MGRSAYLPKRYRTGGRGWRRVESGGRSSGRTSVCRGGLGRKRGRRPCGSGRSRGRRSLRGRRSRPHTGVQRNHKIFKVCDDGSRKIAIETGHLHCAYEQLPTLVVRLAADPHFTWKGTAKSHERAGRFAAVLADRAAIQRERVSGLGSFPSRDGYQDLVFRHVRCLRDGAGLYDVPCTHAALVILEMRDLSRLNRCASSSSDAPR